MIELILYRTQNGAGNFNHHQLISGLLLVFRNGDYNKFQKNNRCFVVFKARGRSQTGYVTYEEGGRQQKSSHYG